jgi:hypothetical protein
MRRGTESWHRCRLAGLLAAVLIASDAGRNVTNVSLT